jgi:type VI secretion system secreted protein Hcp
MAINAYMKVTGQKQGQIKGDATQKGKEGQIEILDLTYSLISPRDAASGLPTGKRLHKPVTVTARTGRQTPLLFSSASQNENMTKVEIDVYLPTIHNGADTGTTSIGFRIDLVNASVSEFDLNLAPENSLATDLLDQYSFTFQKITLTWLDGGITATDDWEAPVTG